MPTPQDILKILMLPAPQEGQIETPVFGAPTEMSEADFLTHAQALRLVNLQIAVSAGRDVQIWHGPILIAAVSHWECEGQQFLIVRLYPHSAPIVKRSVESAIKFELIATNIADQINAHKAAQGE